MEFEFIETDIFTKEIGKVVSDAEYGKLQAALIHKPDLGALIPGGQGVRKLRWALADKGKSGGVRVLYYLYLSEHQIYMLYVFRKSDQSDLSREQLFTLGHYIKKYLKH